MKFRFVLISLFFVACSTSTKLMHKNSPVIDAKSDWTEYRIGSDWYRGQWRIAPEVEHDTLKVTCHNSKVPFEFKTDVDNIQFMLKPNTSKDFYIRMNDTTYAHTVIQAIKFRPDQLEFSESKDSGFNFKYQTTESEYLEELKSEYPLEFITSGMSDKDIVLATLNWTNSRWQHNGSNSPSKNDAITILNEAKEGQQFPCFAYAIVLRYQLNILGYNARTIYLKTKDAEHRTGSPGHVATEVYLDDLQKWVFIDGQFNVMPVLNDTPLNAVEFQDAISNQYEKFELQSLSNQKTTKANYVKFVYDYLYYFDTSLDNRYGEKERFKIDGKRSIMLVPLGAENLTHIDFWNMDVDYCIYTNSLNDFYAKPN
ncbi:hypothetical protein J8281_12610 [Aquimarina sp. U1-2]|uniref:transglutaminase domain-containing protein n=1 Tax=Aquimarina sp. U1-2 TaxID=2823141 RepID=UPI001AEC9E2E|nr:hypothetical protein [Aquimarina sp. U1-2]MBP2833031.1 hypothetical protein [Aquimarina sp. U1-2]